MMNNPLKDYFLSTKAKENLKTSKDIAAHLNLSISIVNNAMNGKTVNPSRKLVSTLSKNINQKPELILRDIYNNSFVNPCNKCVKIITASLHYNFGYALFFNERNFIQFYQIPLPFATVYRICSFAKIRNNGPELKYTLVLDWGSMNPLLYDENAEYSIRDVDMLNG